MRYRAHNFLVKHAQWEAHLVPALTFADVSQAAIGPAKTSCDWSPMILSIKILNAARVILICAPVARPSSVEHFGDRSWLDHLLGILAGAKSRIPHLLDATPIES